MKQQKNLFLTLIIFFLLFSGCFSSWQEDTGTIILNLGSNSRKLGDFPPEDTDLNDIKYEVTFEGANDEFTLNSNGSQSIKTTVTSGEWKIMVKAYYYGHPNSTNNNPAQWIMFAIGKKTVIVKPGQYNPVTVKMSNEGVVEFNFVRVNGNSQVEKYKFNIEFLQLPNNYKTLDFLGKGPHKISLEKGTWYITVDNNVYNEDGTVYDTLEKVIINGEEDPPYKIVINPGDHAALFIEITN